MALTPQDVEQKTFSTALRGYDLDEVDDFLDEIVSTLRGLHEKLEQAESAPAAPQAEVEPAPAPAPAVDESAVGRVLVTAQQTADSIVADAKSEAESIVDEAKSQAETTLEEAKSEADTWAAQRDAKRAEAETEMSELAQHVASVRTQLAVLATAVADRLDEMDQTIEAPVAELSPEPGDAVTVDEEAEQDQSDEGTSETYTSGDDDIEAESEGPEDEVSTEPAVHKPEVFVIGGRMDEDEEPDGDEDDPSEPDSGDEGPEEDV